MEGFGHAGSRPYVRCMADFHHLKAWQHAKQLAVECARAATMFPPEERFALADQLRRAAYAADVKLDGVKCIVAAKNDAKADKTRDYKDGKVYFCCDNCPNPKPLTCSFLKCECTPETCCFTICPKAAAPTATPHGLVALGLLLTGLGLYRVSRGLRG